MLWVAGLQAGSRAATDLVQDLATYFPSMRLPEQVPVHTHAGGEQLLTLSFYDRLRSSRVSRAAACHMHASHELNLSSQQLHATTPCWLSVHALA